MLTHVLEQVRCGRDFDRALADYPGIFNGTYIGVVRAGMSSGQIGRRAAADRRLSRQPRQDHQEGARRADLSGACCSPPSPSPFMSWCSASCRALQTLFASYGKALPAPTQFVLDIGHVYAEYWPFMLGGDRHRRHGLLRLDAHHQRGASPSTASSSGCRLFGNLMRLSAIARFAQTLAIQVQNSVGLIESIRVAAPGQQQQIYRAQPAQDRRPYRAW